MTNMREKTIQIEGVTASLGSWKPDEAMILYESLEKPNWAPWLAASPTSLAGRAQNFPEGQLCIKHDGVFVASLSLNRVDWDGKSEHLPTWDQVAGDPTDYGQTYTPTGNTLVLLSMNVSPAWKGKRVPEQLLVAATNLAHKLNVTHLIGSFRPSGYGAFKQSVGGDCGFSAYCALTREGMTKPVDPWLGSLWHMGMTMLAEDPNAMRVGVSLGDFVAYQSIYHVGQW